MSLHMSVNLKNGFCSMERKHDIGNRCGKKSYTVSYGHLRNSVLDDEWGIILGRKGKDRRSENSSGRIKDGSFQMEVLGFLKALYWLVEHFVLWVGKKAFMKSSQTKVLQFEPSKDTRLVQKQLQFKRLKIIGKTTITCAPT